MSGIMGNISQVWPELWLLGAACGVLVVDLFLSERTRMLSYLLAQLALLGAAVLTVAQISGEQVLVFDGHFVHDAMGDVLKVFIYLVSGLVFLYSRDYLLDRGLFKGEYYVLGLFGVLGMMILVSAHSLLTVYLGLELMSLSMYAMVAFHRSSPLASEAAMKYFVLGALASGMLLYGMSMIYGATGALDVAAVAEAAGRAGENDLALRFGLVFLVIGIAFKLGLVPFHMWLPDVYHGAPTAVTLYIGAAPKIAAFAMAMRLLVDGLVPLLADWQPMLVLLAILSLAVGNFVAIAQTNLKRMLAYSTISHAGFIALGLLAGTPGGYAAAMFYAISYALMAAGAFGIIIVMSRAGFEADDLDDYRGLNERSPWIAGMMLILMFSMAGVPPTLGFFAKLAILEAVVDVGRVWLAAGAVAFTIVGAYYYLRVVKLMYFDRPQGERLPSASLDTRIVVSANSLAILLLGFFPGALLSVCTLAIG